MYTQNDGAWVKNAADEAKMLDTMRKGADVVIKATTSRGTQTTDTFSLKGISRRRVDRASQECRLGCRVSWRSGRTCPSVLDTREPAPRWIMTAVLETDIALEKTPLERYVPPAKPSLVGLSRAALADALGAIGVAPAQRKMRVQQLWHWLYVRGAQNFDQMTSVSKELRAVLDAHFTLARPEVVAEQVSVDGTRKWLLRLPGEVARRAAARGRVRLYPGDRPRHAVRLEPGRLHADLLVLPHRHAAAGAQPHAGRDRRPGHGGARPARRLYRHGRARKAPACRPAASAPSPTS